MNPRSVAAETELPFVFIQCPPSPNTRLRGVLAARPNYAMARTRARPKRPLEPLVGYRPPIRLTSVLGVSTHVPRRA